MKKYYLLFALLSMFLFSNAQGPTLDAVVTTTPIVCYGADATVTANMTQTIPGTPVKLLNYKYAGAIGSSLFSFGSSGVTTGATQPFTDLPAFNYRMFMVDSIAFYTAFPPGPNSPLQPELQNPTHPSIFDYKDYSVSQPTAILVTETISNISCNAGSDGEVTLNSSGGTGALVEDWGTTNPTQLSVGTYSYTVTDASSCTYNGSVTITEPTTLISSGFISQGIIGNGNSNGQITGSVSGGTAPYQYSINNAVFQSNPVFSNLGFGTYQITYKDTNDCTVTEQILLTQPAPVSGNISIYSSASCNGSCDGALQFNVIGGSSPFTYSLNNGAFQSSPIFSNLCGDSLYSITVKDDNSSTFVSSVYLNQPNILTFNTVVQNINGYGVSCNWDCDGAISINNVSGGAGAPITYSFDGGNTFSQIWSSMGLCPDDYYIAVQDGSGCIFRDTVSFTAPDSLQVVSFSSTNISCFDGTDGDIQFDSVVGGVMPYTYSISDTASTNCVWSGSPSGLCSLGAGEYYIQVVDANGCLVQNSVILTQPSEMVVNFSVQNNFMPYDDSAAISTAISGGTPPYSVNWTGPNGFLSNQEDIIELFSGIYYVTIADANGCTINDTIEINEPGEIWGCTDSSTSSPALNYNPLANIDNGLCYYCPLNVTYQLFFPLNNFTCNGAIIAVVDSGQGIITYNWSNSVVGTGNAYAYITNLCNDTFSVTILDSGIPVCGADTTILLSTYIGCTDSTMSNWNPLALFDDGSCEPIVYGCTDFLAFNYDSTANVDNGSCVPFVYGCMDTLALNYNPSANTDDGSCVLPILGCMDSTAINFNPSANVDDGSCIAIVYGCTDPTAANYNPLANIDDNSCWFCNWGCMDSSAWNYDPLATCNNSLCVPFIYGCTDPFSFNYNLFANTDDGSCLATVFGCTDSLAYNYDPLANTDNGTCYNCSFSTPFWLIDSTNIDSCQAFALIDISSINGAPLSYTWNTILGTYCCSPSLPWAENLCLGVYSVTVEDSYGCSMSDTITIGNINLGCTDPFAINYDSLATLDDGSCCLPPVVDLTIGDWFFNFDWGCQNDTNFYEINYNSDSTWSNSFSGLWQLCGVNYTHSYFVDSVTVYTGIYANGVITGTMTDSISSNTGCFSIYLDSSSVTLGCMDSTACNYVAAANWDDGSCTYQGCTDAIACNYVAAATCDDGSCIFPDGCTDATACNYDPAATCDDGSCLSSAGCTDATATNYDPLATCDDGSCIYVIYGCTDATALNYYAGANTDDNSCVYVAGCTDATACNFDPLSDFDDGSCEWTSCGGTACAEDAPTGLNATNVLQNRATINWDNMNDADCMVDQYRINYSDDGGATWTQKNMGQPVGSCLWAANNTDKLILNLTPSTTYTYRMKAWYCGGGNSAWSTNETFTTEDDCPNVGNIAVTTPTTTKATFTWDDSNGAYSFVRVQARVDTTGATFFNIGGVGVNYPTFTKDKNGLVAGESYRAKSRTWCNPNGGAYKAPSWTSFIYWTQPTVIRLAGGTAINNLEVYPNPSRDIFNVTFTSEDVQDLKVRILNIVGEELISENLEQFVGEYTKQIDLATYPKGIYFLEVSTNNGIINKKLILQ